MHPEHTLGSEVNNKEKMAIAITLPEILDVLSSRSLNFLQNAPTNSIHLTSLFSCGSVSNASLRVKVSENDGNI